MIGLISQVILTTIILLIFGCDSLPVATDVSLISNPNTDAPLAGILTFTTDRQVVPTLFITDGKNEQIVTPDNEPRTEHEVMVLGLRPDRTHNVVVSISDEGGRESVLDTLRIVTPPLPDDFPPIELTQSASGVMEPGVTMMNVFRWKSKFNDDPDWGLAVAIDEAGEVIWYLKTDYGLSESRRMFNGNLMIGGHLDGRQYEINMLGNIIREWHSSGLVIGEIPEESIPVETDNFHHDVIQTASGNFIGLGLEVVQFENFPAEYPPGTKREAANVAGDVLIEYTPSGNTVRKWPDWTSWILNASGVALFDVDFMKNYISLLN